MTDGPHRHFFVFTQTTAGMAPSRSAHTSLRGGGGLPDTGPGRQRPGVAGAIDRPPARVAGGTRGADPGYTNHFSLCTAELIYGRCTMLTLPREPVERTLSYLRHYRATNQPIGTGRSRRSTMTPFRFHGLAYKYMTKMLSLTPAEMTAGMLTPLDFNRGRLQRAKGALARIGAVGLQGHFDHFCRFLAARFGRHLGEPVEPSRSNRRGQRRGRRAV